MIRSLSDINWNQLYYFYEAGRRQSLKRTAESLNISSPTLSEHIKKLERTIDAKLFIKKSRKFILTEKGQELFWSCREIFENGHRVIDSISSQSLGGYAVRVGVQDSLLESLSLQFITEYNDLFAPYGTVHTIREADDKRLFNGLEKGEFDWIITSKPARSRKTDYEFIDKYKIEFACSKEIYNKFKKAQDILNTLPLALSSNDNELNKIILDYLADRQIYPNEFTYTDHREFSIHLALRGRCVTLLPVNQPDEFWESDLKTFNLGLKQSIQTELFASWRTQSINMISIQKLKELLTLKTKPLKYHDQNLLIEISDVDEDKLT